jgi:hypothetical protein
MKTHRPVTSALGLWLDIKFRRIPTANSARLGKIMSSDIRTLILPMSVCKDAQTVARHVAKNRPANICRVGYSTSHGQKLGLRKVRQQEHHDAKHYINYGLDVEEPTHSFPG